MLTRQQELNTLQRIKSLLNDKARAEQEKGRLQSRREEYLKTVDSVTVHQLPTNRQEEMKKQIALQAADSTRKAKIWAWIIAGFVIAAIVVAMVLYVMTLKSPAEPLIHTIFALLTFVCIKMCLKWGNEDRKLLSGGAFLFGINFAILAIEAFCLAVWIFLLVIAVVVVATILCTKLVGKKNDTKLYSYNAQKLAEAAMEDSLNASLNSDNLQKEKERVRQEMAPRIKEVDNEIQNCDNRIAQLDYEIRNNGRISERDLANIDFLIDKISTNRADSIKEALRLLDDKKYREQQESRQELNRWLDEQKRKQERRAWEDEHRSYLDREERRLRDHREKVEDELREIRKQLED